MSIITNWATNAFGTGSGVGSKVSAIPRQRFNFRLRLTLADGGAPIVFERVSDVTLPNYDFDTQILNQYNKKRVVQTKLNYGTCQVNFYDTHDNAFANIFKRYINF